MPVWKGWHTEHSLALANSRGRPFLIHATCGSGAGYGGVFYISGSSSVGGCIVTEPQLSLVLLLLLKK